MEPEDVGVLMRGHFRFFVWGCPCLGVGHRSMIGHTESSGIPLPWSRPHYCTIDVVAAFLPLDPGVATKGLWAGRALPTTRAVHSPGRR
jgi:hypothetical protein